MKKSNNLVPILVLAVRSGSGLVLLVLILSVRLCRCVACASKLPSLCARWGMEHGGKALIWYKWPRLKPKTTRILVPS